MKLEGLDHANCAMKIEEAVTKINGAEETRVNFMTTKMSLRGGREPMPEIFSQAEK